MDAMPFLRYVDPSGNPRPEHLVWSGPILRRRFRVGGALPANGWRCYCYVGSLGEKDLERARWEAIVVTPAGGEDPCVNPRTMVPRGVDPSFAHDPGIAGNRYAADQALREKLAAVGQNAAAVVGRLRPKRAE